MLSIGKNEMLISSWIGKPWIKMLNTWCITQVGNMSNENTLTGSLHYIQNIDFMKNKKLNLYKRFSYDQKWLWICTYLLVDDFLCKSKLIRLSWKMDFCSISFDACRTLFASFPASWVIYIEDALLMICWSVHWRDTLCRV